MAPYATNANVNCSAYTGVHLDYMADVGTQTGGGTTYTVALTQGNILPPDYSSTVFVIQPTDNSWHTVDIPYSSFIYGGAALDPTQLGAVMIQVDGSNGQRQGLRPVRRQRGLRHQRRAPARERHTGLVTSFEECYATTKTEWCGNVLTSIGRRVHGFAPRSTCWPATLAEPAGQRRPLQRHLERGLCLHEHGARGRRHPGRQCQRERHFLRPHQRGAH